MGIFDAFRRKRRSFFPETATFAGPAGSLLFPADKNPTVSACVDKISKTLSTLPLQVYRNTKNGMEPATGNGLYYALESPSNEETPTLFYRSMYRFLLYKGNTYLYKDKRADGRIVGFTLVNPNKVTLSRRDEDGRKRYLIEGRYYTDDEILHIPYPGAGYNGTEGKSPIEVHRDLIDMDNNLLMYVSNYFNNSVGSRLVINLGDSYPQRKGTMDQLYAEIVPVMNKFVLGAANAGKPMISLPDSTIGKLDQNSNAQAQLKSLIDTVEHQIALSCFGVPYEVLDSAASKYDSLESKQNDFLANCIKPLGDHICQSFEKLLTPGERVTHSIRYEYKNLLTTNTKDTVDFLTKEFKIGRAHV